MVKSENVSLYSVGDISFMGSHMLTPTLSVFSDIKEEFSQGDIVIANLEAPLLKKSYGAVPGKCTMWAIDGWASILKESGIDIVSLANNHMMDFGVKGLNDTISALDKVGVSHVGAGDNIDTASKPLVKIISGTRIAIFARCSVEVSSECFATESSPGVAFLDEHELINAIKSVRNKVDVIVLLLHWGLEHYNYPTSQQRKLAKDLVTAGADIILGHHPHVLQGHEYIDKALISYSSGNFTFKEFEWADKQPDGNQRRYFSKLTRDNRKGLIFIVENIGSGEFKERQVHTYINEKGYVQIDDNEDRKTDYLRYCNRLKYKLYGTFWKLYSLKREWDLRLKSALSPVNLIMNLYKIRPRHIKELFTLIRRSGKITSGKSTNPYEG